MEFGLNSSLDLYKRLTPAMNCKIREVAKEKKEYLKKEDVWNFLMQSKWKDEKGITLAEMVDDILNLDNLLLLKYLDKQKELERNKREEIEFL